MASDVEGRTRDLQLTWHSGCNAAWRTPPLHGRKVLVDRSLYTQMEARPTQPRNIYVVGAQCTGKTTLVDALGEHFRNPTNRIWHGDTIPEPLLVKEVARTVLREHNFAAADITSSAERALQLQRLILQAQDQAEEAARSGWFVSDRSGLDPIIYAKVYASEDAALGMLETASWVRLREKMRNAAVFVCEAGPKWLTDDGVRLMPRDDEDWTSLHGVFCKVLRDSDIEFTIVSKEMTDLSERVALVIKLWQARDT